jgi:Peptidase family M28/PDZ domain/PA domain
MGIMKKIFKIICIFILSFPVFGQNNQDSIKFVENAKKHIYYLASDELKGRLTGSEGERKAFEYIKKEFKKYGLKPFGNSNDYIQSFQFIFKKEADKNTVLKINNNNMEPGKDFYPLSYSSNSSAKGKAFFVNFGIEADDLNYNDYAGLKNLQNKIFVIETSSPDGNHPHSKYLAYLDLHAKIETAIEKGAAGIIFINHDKQSDDPSEKLKSKAKQYDIPVVFLKSSDEMNIMDGDQEIEMNVQINTIEKEGHNVIGFLDNHQKNTIIIGAHYDHLGMGVEGSLYDGGPAIHNGADDNASGTAMLIELARELKNKKYSANNYLFIAFSGEELGLYGSNYFVKNPTLDLSKTNYMINMDMVGRFDTSKGLMINGVGTSPDFEDLTEINHRSILAVKTSKSGVGPSDHTSFYLNDMPVLHFFTGAHDDYHKPSDKPEKINFGGMVMINDYILNIIAHYNAMEKIDFSKTKDNESEKAPKFSVTLGVIPNYMFDGEGMQIDGIRDGKPADKAGMQKGDVVVQIGDIKVYDMRSYMNALGYFKKGDKAIVKIKRDDELLDFEIQF